MFRTCKICGKTSDITNFPKNGKYYRHYCKQCDTERVKNAIFKTVAYIQSKKEKCAICGYNKDQSALEFHHEREDEKEFNIARCASGRMWSRKIKDLIDNEIKKCVCLCANCHREKHSKEIPAAVVATIDFSFETRSKSEIAKEAYIKFNNMPS